jgi:hypothetical protein
VLDGWASLRSLSSRALGPRGFARDLPRTRLRVGACVSNPLDIVRLIDARLAAVPAIISRSKQAVIAAEQDLDQHQKWARRHSERCAADLKRHQRRLRHRRVMAACRRVVLALVLLVPSLGMALFRGAVQDLIFLHRLLWRSCSWIVVKVRTLELWLTGLLVAGVSCMARGLDALGICLVDLLALGLIWIRRKGSYSFAPAGRKFRRANRAIFRATRRARARPRRQQD